MHWFIDPIKNHFADFSGRATRQQFWMFTLLHTVILFSFVIAGIMLMAASIPAGIASFEAYDGTVNDSYFSGLVVFSFVLVLVIVTAIPYLALTIRRLHDINLSGWWYLVAFIPVFGAIFFWVAMCLPSKPGSNKWGANPYGIGVAQPSTQTPVLAADVTQPTPGQPEIKA